MQARSGLPHAPPFLPSSRQIVSDYLTPWSPHVLAWFNYVQDNVYRPVWDFNIGGADDIDTAFYLDHSISAHYGHYIGDCLSRMYAWDIAQGLFEDLKMIISDGAGADFQTNFLNIMGVPDEKIVRIKGMVRCRQLLLATRSLNIHSYASPTSARLWGLIRDRSAVRDTSFPDRIYLSRSGIGRRRMANESDVEEVFERHGFAIIRPEVLPVKLQIALASNALLVAGPGGSSMFNLAFQGRMRSAFILRPDDFLQLPEMLLSAGCGVDLWFHLGGRLPGENPETTDDAWAVDMAAMQRDLADWLDHTGLAQG